MADMDFPTNPTLGQIYTNSLGIVYEWNGVAWVVGFYDSGDEGFDVLGDLLTKIRELLQDTDTLGSEYRYSTASLVSNINMGLLEMYRIRPDIFLELNFQVPTYNEAEPDAPILIEHQFAMALIYYAVGMAQLRDEEGSQDERAGGFLTKFTSMLATVA